MHAKSALTNIPRNRLNSTPPPPPDSGVAK